MNIINQNDSVETARSFISKTPLEQFNVISLISIQSPMTTVKNIFVTNIALYVIIVIFIIFGIHTSCNNKYYIVPSKISVIIESIYATVLSIVQSQVGNNYEKYLPFIYTLFWFVIIGNLNGNIPYGYTITTSIITTIGLSVTVFLGVTLLGMTLHKIHGISYFVPTNTPLPLAPILTLIETISYFARSVSLGVRLFSNVVAGHTLLAILSSFLYKLFSSGGLIFIFTLIPFAIFVALIGLELAVSLIQGYVLTVLTSSYISEANKLH